MDLNSMNEVKEAIISNNVDKLSILLGTNQDDLNYVMPVGSWLHFAVRTGNIDIIKKLLDMNIDTNLLSPSHKGNSLVNAARGGNLEIIQLLLDNEVNLETKWSSANPLQEAIANGRNEAFQLLLALELDELVSLEEKEELCNHCIEYAEIFSNAIIIEAIEKVKKKYQK